MTVARSCATIASAFVLAALAGCPASGDGGSGPRDVGAADAEAQDGSEPGADVARRLDAEPAVDVGLSDGGTLPDAEPVDLGLLASIQGRVVMDDPSVGTATISLFVPGAPTTAIPTTPSLDFQVFAPIGVPVFVRADADRHVPRLQGYVLTANGDTRDFYMKTRELLADTERVVGPIDPSLGMVWIDFREDSGGYGAELSSRHGASFSLDYTHADNGLPVTSTVTLGGAGSTELVFVGVPTGTVAVTPRAPPGCTCRPREGAPTWGLVQPGAFTQIDFACSCP